MLNENIKGVYLINTHKKISVGENYQVEIPVIIEKDEEQISSLKNNEDIVCRSIKNSLVKRRGLRKRIRFIKK